MVSLIMSLYPKFDMEHMAISNFNANYWNVKLGNKSAHMCKKWKSGPPRHLLSC